jgi:hypothetical protein
MYEIVRLLQVFDDSNGMTLLDALTRGVAIPGNVPLYIAGLTLLSLRDDLPQFLEQPIMTFLDQNFAMIKIGLISQGRSQIVIRYYEKMKTSSTEHPLIYIARLCRPAIRGALIPTGARLPSGPYLTAPNPSSNGSLWADGCPRCGYSCGNFDHMDNIFGTFPNLGRGMWESIINETANGFLMMFFSQYAKFVCWVLENPFIFANRWIRRSISIRTGCEFEMGIPSLPVIFKEKVFLMQTLLHCFEQLQMQDGSCRIVPKPFMMIIDPAKYKPIDDSASRRRVKPKSKKMGPHTGMLTKVAKSLGCFGGFADSILRRVLHTPSEGIFREFKDENLILTEKLMRILGHFQNEDLIQVFEILEQALHL